MSKHKSPADPSARQIDASKPFMWVSEVAAVFGADERTIRRAIAAGEIPAVRIGRTVRVPTSWVMAVAHAEPTDRTPGLRVVHGLAERRTE